MLRFFYRKVIYSTFALLSMKLIIKRLISENYKEHVTTSLKGCTKRSVFDLLEIEEPGTSPRNKGAK